MKNQFTFELGCLSLKYTPRVMRTLEKFSIQFAYGHREILLDFMGVDRSNILLGVLQHGVTQLGLTADTEFTRDNVAPRVGFFERAPYWVYSEITRNHLITNGVKNVEAIGAPWNYIEHDRYRDNFDPQNNSVSRFIVFPQHRNANIEEEVLRDDLKERIAYWKDLANNQELTICIFWSEFIHPVWQQVCFEEGVKLVTAGIGDTIPRWSPHRSRVEFLHNLSTILQKNTHCIFERETSGMFYAISLGLTVGYFPRTRPFLNSGSIKMHNLFLSKFPETLNQFVCAEKLRDTSDMWLGRNSIRSPDELKSILKFESSILER